MKVMQIKNLETEKKGLVRGIVTVTESMTKPKSGDAKPYLKVDIEDNSEKMTVMVWDNSTFFPVFKAITTGDFIEAEAEYLKTDARGFKEYKLNTVEKKERPGTGNILDYNGLKNELRNIMSSVQHMGLKQLLINIFSRDDVKIDYFIAPNTEKSGYSFKGGVLARSVRICKLIDAVLSVYRDWAFNTDNFVVQLDRDLLITVGILENLGSIWYYKLNGSKVEKTIEGELFENTYLTIREVLKELDKVELTEVEKILLEHTLTSTRERNQFGSINTPRNKEALAFNAVARLDTAMANFEFLDRMSMGGDFAKLIEKQYCLINFND